MGHVCFCNTIQIHILSLQKTTITNKLNLCAGKKMLYLLKLSLCKRKTKKKISKRGTNYSTVFKTHTGEVSFLQVIYAFNFKQPWIKINLSVGIRSHYSAGFTSH